MLSWLKTHPFAVEAFIEHSLVLTFAAPVAEIQALLPAPLVADSFADRWGFLAVALVQTRNLRPKGFPSWLGQDFYLIGYRAFVRYPAPNGKRLRGLYILGSETDKPRMSALGNVFTHYQYTTTDIVRQQIGGGFEVNSQQSDLHVRLAPASSAVPLPPASPFATWSEARRFAGPLPFTFSIDAGSPRMLIVEGVRQHWEPQPVAVESSHVGFFTHLKLSSLVLANAFALQDVPYHWKKGRTEQWRR
ncbi:DUF2071 domain-containing protein [Hymenobacter sp. BT683]|uniref:DUF2071 domain-containing protein n=1 Tax=Hymenobacter jeongseonensis TaxID=2791027 RepID=A0ABS0IGV9_9BACT|nr:DUF2071 domain-containing protein [Hymenobacter jeongseonensis]MBF9237580.1 DUF2071 domain-containing protein [Hymenobacter jeongseonensis]